MEEKNFYNDQCVTVTSARVQPSHGVDIVLIIVGRMIGIFGVCATGIGGGADRVYIDTIVNAFNEAIVSKR